MPTAQVYIASRRMFSTKKPAAKKQRSWETVDADDDDAPSETFLKLQQELADRERLAQEKAEEAVAAAAAAADAAAHQAAKAAAGRGGDGDGQSASLADATAAAAPSQTTVEVQDFNGRTRLHELKAHFHQFGDVVEVALMGKKVYRGAQLCAKNARPLPNARKVSWQIRIRACILFLFLSLFAFAMHPSARAAAALVRA